MLGVYVTVPVACFRKGLAREYLETEPLPPPATCYGFLLSLVGETDRRRHVGVRVVPVLLSKPTTSVVLRTVWRVKERPLGSPGNTRPDYQLPVWVDHVGSAGTRYAVGDLREIDLDVPPPIDQMPLISDRPSSD